jgi:hypothetical protein
MTLRTILNKLLLLRLKFFKVKLRVGIKSNIQEIFLDNCFSIKIQINFKKNFTS